MKSNLKKSNLKKVRIQIKHRSGGNMSVIIGLVAAASCGVVCTAGAYAVDKFTRK